MDPSNAEKYLLGHGPFRADMVREGDPYEISNGHPVLCMPTGERGGAGVMVGGIAIGSDPGLDDIGASLGTEVGYSPRPEVLRAPDLSVTPGTNNPGWVKGVPPLAIEYADKGQDEGDLKLKINELLEAGTEAVWVVRLTGARRVEVYHNDGTIGLVLPGQSLTAPGILRRPIPIEALYERDAALKHAMENHLSRFGYRSLDEVRAEGRQEGGLEGLRSALRRVLGRRRLALSAEQDVQIAGEQDPDRLARWIESAVDAPDVTTALSA